MGTIAGEGFSQWFTLKPQGRHVFAIISYWPLIET